MPIAATSPLRRARGPVMPVTPSASARARPALLGLLLVLPLVLPGLPTAAADSLVVMPTRLPSARWTSTAVWAGDAAFAFSGTGAAYEVVRYDPSSGTVATKGASTFPIQWGAAAAWNGTTALLFGGFSGDDLGSSLIQRYDPVADALTNASATVPAPSGRGRWAASATWNGTFAFVFGGRNGYDYTGLTDVLRYDPVAGAVETMPAALPSGRAYTTAVWTGEHAFVFGGFVTGTTYLDEIVRYTPATNVVTTMMARLPNPRASAAAVWTGDHVLIFGGADGSQKFADVLRYDPAADTIETLAATLPTPRDVGTAVWDGASAFLLGGQEAVNRTDEIVRYRPWDPPGAPRDLAVATGPGGGELSLTWRAPASDGGKRVTGYRIYSGATPEDLALRAEIGDDLTWTDTGLGNGVTRHYRVSARNLVGEGPLGNLASNRTAVPPTAPRNFTATTEIDLQHVDLAWEPPADAGGLPLTKYAISRTKALGGAVATWDVPPGATAYRDVPPTFGVYEYAIAAVNPAGEGARSNEACAVGGRITTESPAYVQAMMARGCPAT